MMSNVKIKIAEIESFCAKWKVVEFSLFGSVLREDFRPESDVDILISFSNDAEWDLFDLVDMRDELKNIFGREIDIVEKGTIRNPFREQAIMDSREVLYAA